MKSVGGAPGPPGRHTEGPGPPPPPSSPGHGDGHVPRAGGHHVAPGRPASTLLEEGLEFGFSLEAAGGRQGTTVITGDLTKEAAPSDRLEDRFDSSCLQFLSLEDGNGYGVLTEADRRVLLAVQEGDSAGPCHNQASIVHQQDTAEESLEIEFGCASEVFNSITAGNFKPGPDPVLRSEMPPVLLPPPPPPVLGPVVTGPGSHHQQVYLPAQIPAHYQQNQVHAVPLSSCPSSLGTGGSPVRGQQFTVLPPPGGNSNDQREQVQQQPGVYSAVVSLYPNESQQQMMSAAPRRVEHIDGTQPMVYPAPAYPVSAQQIYYSPPPPPQQALIRHVSVPVEPPASNNNKESTSTNLQNQNSSAVNEPEQTVEMNQHQQSQIHSSTPKSGMASGQQQFQESHQQVPGVPQQHPGVPGATAPQPHLHPGGTHQQHPGAPPQHIHINHFTANLTYLPAVSSASTAQPLAAGSSTAGGAATRQPVPFATYPLNYVAPFPPSSAASPPMFSSTPFPPPMVIYPPGHSVHFSMFTPPPTTSRPESREHSAQPVEEHAGTPVVSIKKLVEEEEEMDENKDDRSMSPNSESQQEESQVAIMSYEPQQKLNEEPELRNLYENKMTNGNGEVEMNVATSARKHLEDNKVMHQPTPPPFPIPGEGTDMEGGGGQMKSWASLLFSSTDPGVERIHVDKPMARIPPFSTSLEGSTSASGMPGLDGDESGRLTDEQLALGSYLKTYEPNHAAASILPRGLTNRSNWCFVNSILQALLACPPFFNLFKSLPNVVGLNSGGKSLTPMLDAVVEFVNEFKPLETMVVKNLKKDKGRKGNDVPVDITFEPSYVYNVLLESKSLSFDEGRQEDAEELLTHILNKLDEEMRSLIKVTQTKEAAEVSSNQVGEWQETKGKSCVTRRVVDSTTATRTPVQSIFVGLTRSSVIAENCETSATLQPYVTLQLDIQSPDHLDNLEDVLLHNFASKPLEGYRNPRSGQVARASQTLSLEELSPVLILHLKRMIHDGRTEQKVMKEIQFPVDLPITPDILSANCKTRYTKKQRLYKLFAVVYHNGKEAIKGHYVTDIYHTGYGCWLRCNDSTVSGISEDEVTSPMHHSTPYILFYRQRDTMGAADRNKIVPAF